MEIYKVIGLMSGTSLDGLDMAYCLLVYDKNWTFSIECAETIAYDPKLKNSLQKATSLQGYELALLDSSLGKFFGKQTRKFIDRHHLQPDFIASHGHTVFHQPGKGVTLQIGDGNAIAAQTGIPVIYDFRSLDVALGGQGAPLVPIGDQLLFSDYAACMNLGGIANISFEKEGEYRAFDICPANMVLNFLSEKKGLAYDDAGKLARSGQCIDALLSNLDALPYYQNERPKSLGKEWVVDTIIPLFDLEQYNIEDFLHTFNQHMANQISRVVTLIQPGKLLISGGGAYNNFLMELLRKKTGHKVFIPSKTIIDYKEALIFALLGVLRMRNEVNTLASVTGASADSCGGVIAGGLGR